MSSRVDCSTKARQNATDALQYPQQATTGAETMSTEKAAKTKSYKEFALDYKELQNDTDSARHIVARKVRAHNKRCRKQSQKIEVWDRLGVPETSWEKLHSLLDAYYTRDYSKPKAIVDTPQVVDAEIVDSTKVPEVHNGITKTDGMRPTLYFDNDDIKLAAWKTSGETREHTIALQMQTNEALPECLASAVTYIQKKFQDVKDKTDNAAAQLENEIPKVASEVFGTRVVDGE